MKGSGVPGPRRDYEKSAEPPGAHPENPPGLLEGEKVIKMIKIIKMMNLALAWPGTQDQPSEKGIGISGGILDSFALGKKSSLLLFCGVWVHVDLLEGSERVWNWKGHQGTTSATGRDTSHCSSLAWGPFWDPELLIPMVHPFPARSWDDPKAGQGVGGIQARDSPAWRPPRPHLGGDPRFIFLILINPPHP